MEKNIAVIYGDCASPEIVTQALRVLDAVAAKFGHTFTYTKVLMGGEAIDAYGDPLPQPELDKCLASDSVLLGAIGGPKWEGLPGEKRAEKGLLRLRSGMGLYANNRPARIWPQLSDASPLKPSIVEKGIDFIVVRELIGGVYFGEHKTYEKDGEKIAVDTMPYSEHEIERIGRIGFETARKRRKRLTCVDKANVLDTSRLWREVMHRLAAEYPDVEYREMFVDNCAMQICKDPSQFDVSSRRTCSATSCPTRPARSPAASAWCPPPAWGTAPGASTSPSTAPPRTSPARTSSTPSPASCPRP